MLREGVLHHGIELRFGGRSHRIPLSELAGGRAIMLYAQHEVIRDLVRVRLAAGGTVVFDATQASIHDIDGPRPAVRFRHGGHEHGIDCDFVVGCDGFHGVSRESVPAAARTEYTHTYPFAWFGLLVNAPRYSPELIYARHERGFSLVSTRSESVQRLYLQCDPSDAVDQWPDERIWAELDRRLETTDGHGLSRGGIFQKGVVQMRSFVCEPMRFGSLFLAGDAAHIVPPTGAKGLNLAVADVQLLATAFAAYYGDDDRAGLDTYSAEALERVWAVQHFSWWMTTLLHRFGNVDPLEERLQRAQLEEIVASVPLQTSLAERYVGRPLKGRVPRARLPATAIALDA